MALMPLVGCVTPAVRKAHEKPAPGASRGEPFPAWVPEARAEEDKPEPKQASSELPFSEPPLVAAPIDESPASELGVMLARRAALYVGLKSLRKVTKEVTDDCSGFARLVFHGQGIELYQDGFLPGESGVAAIYRRARVMGALHDGLPRPGDLVFFHDTYDRNRNGRHDDGLTHIGVVESIDGDGTVTFIHRYGLGVKRSKLNVGAPTLHANTEGHILNDYLRRATRKERSRLTGELFSGYASPEGL